MIAALALMLIAQAAEVPHARTSSAAVVVLNAAQFQRVKNITIDAISTAAHLRVDLDTCAADKSDAIRQRDRARVERDQLRVDLVNAPAPAFQPRTEAPWWVLPAIVGVGAAAALGGATACALLHCNL